LLDDWRERGKKGGMSIDRLYGRKGGWEGREGGREGGRKRERERLTFRGGKPYGARDVGENGGHQRGGIRSQTW